MQQEVDKRALRRNLPPPPEVASAPTTLDDDAFPRCAEHQSEHYKFELSRGRVITMQSGVKGGHARVVKNVVAEIVRHLDQDKFDWTDGGFYLKTPFGFRARDVCVDPALEDLSVRSTDRPIFAAEVLSPSSGGRDFIDKAADYLPIATLQTYLIASQDEPLARVWQQRLDGT